MGTIYFVRHGQASLGAKNYDQLSPMGYQQCHQLGLYFQQQGLQFEAVYSGTLSRQKQTLKTLSEAAGQSQWWCDAREKLALNEYCSESLIQAVHGGQLVVPDTPEGYKQYFVLLRQAVQAWINAEIKPQDLPSFEVFQQNIIAVMKEIQAQHTGDILVVSSGGPISISIAHLLGCQSYGAIELNLRLRNTSVSEVHYHAKRLSVISFNSLPHLAHLPQQAWWTYA